MLKVNEEIENPFKGVHRIQPSFPLLIQPGRFSSRMVDFYSSR